MMALLCSLVVLTGGSFEEMAEQGRLDIEKRTGTEIRISKTPAPKLEIGWAVPVGQSVIATKQGNTTLIQTDGKTSLCTTQGSTTVCF